MFSTDEALSRAAHELRTPLNAILGHGQLLALDQLNLSQRQSVEQILAGGRHLLALIEVDRLFVPFERLSAARRGIEGRGLGLAVSKTLAEAMDGEIEICSTPGAGSVFTLRLPCAQPAPALACVA